MKCEKCGKELTQSSNFCRFCGCPVKIENTSSDNDIIDIDKIQVKNVKHELNLDDDIMELTDDLDIKMDAMKEISKTQSFSLQKTKNDLEKENKYMNDVKSEDIINMEFMPGTLNKIEIDDTTELEKMLLSEENKNDEFETRLIPDSVTNLKINDTEKEEKKEIIKREDEKIIPSASCIKDELVEKSNESKEEMLKKEDKVVPIINSVYEDKVVVKKGKGCLVFLIMLPLLILLGILATYLYMENKNIKKEIKDKNEQIDNLTQQLEKSKDNSSNNIQNNYKYNGYSVKFTNDYVYEIIDDKIIISNNNYKFINQVEEVRYSKIKEKLDDYASMIKEQNFTVNSYGTKVIEGREYVFYEVSDVNEGNNLILYTKLSEDSVIGIFVTFNQNSIDYDVLIEYNEIVGGFQKINSSELNEFNFFED